MDEVAFKRLQWQCRRGMLELDVFLQKFLTHGYAQLSEADQALFASLLESNDQDLFEWLTGRHEADNPEFQRLVEMIRANAKQH